MQTLGNIKNDPGMKFRPRFQRSKFPLGTKIIHTLGVAGIYIYNIIYITLYNNITVINMM